MPADNIDPELRPFLEATLAALPGFEAEGLGELRAGLRALIEADPPTRPDTVRVEDVSVPGPTGEPDVVMRIYRPAAAPNPVPALFWMHGGGMMIGSMDMDEALLVRAVDQFGFAVVSVEYRLAPEHPNPAPVEDCYAGLVWTESHASAYGIDPTCIAVGGASAGGGLAAGTALLAATEEGPRWPFSCSWNPCSTTGQPPSPQLSMTAQPYGTAMTTPTDGARCSATGLAVKAFPVRGAGPCR